jgi:hypothetical protein
VARPRSPVACSGETGLGLAGVVPVWPFFFAFGQWREKGRDPERRAISVQYEPPEDLSPAEVGTLVDHKAEIHDITATLVDLAVRGYVHIEKRTSKTLGLFSNTEYVFHLKKPREEWSDLSSHEERYLNALFKRTGDTSAGGKLKPSSRAAGMRRTPGKGRGRAQPMPA